MGGGGGSLCRYRFFFSVSLDNRLGLLCLWKGGVLSLLALFCLGCKSWLVAKKAPTQGAVSEGPMCIINMYIVKPIARISIGTSHMHLQNRGREEGYLNSRNIPSLCCAKCPTDIPLGRSAQRAP